MAVRRRTALAALALALALPSSARAERGRASRIGAAIFPGVAVHGSGHWVAGDKRTARRLLITEAIGLGLVAVGGLPIAMSGAAPQTLPGLALFIPGCGLFLDTWLADIYGASGGAALGGTPLLEPPLELESGYVLVADPQVPLRHLAALGATAHLRRATVEASGYAGDGLWQARGQLGVRVLGDAAAHLEVVLGASERQFDIDGFRAETLELSARGRYSLERFAPTLAGSFATAELGIEGERVRYDVAGMPHDTTTVLLSRFGYGVRLGRDAEVELYFDQRRDALSGTVVWAKTTFLAGHVGVRAAAYRGRYGLSASIEGGAALVARLGLLIRLSEPTR